MRSPKKNNYLDSPSSSNMMNQSINSFANASFQMNSGGFYSSMQQARNDSSLNKSSMAFLDNVKLEEKIKEL